MVGQPGRLTRAWSGPRVGALRSAEGAPNTVEANRNVTPIVGVPLEPGKVTFSLCDIVMQCEVR